MRWVFIGLVVFSFFIAPVMFRSCSEAEFNRARGRLHNDLEDYRGAPLTPQEVPETDQNW